MKKILAVILAVMMLCGTMAMGTSAAELDTGLSQWHDAGLANNDQVIFIFNMGDGHLRDSYEVYTGVGATGFEYQSGITGQYIMIPHGNDFVQAVGNYVDMPVCIPKDTTTHMFLYWERTSGSSKDQIPGGSPFLVTDDMINGPERGVVQFRAVYTSVDGGGDTLGTILGVLTKVFGAIIGILLYGGDTEAGVAMMDKILGGLDL